MSIKSFALAICFVFSTAAFAKTWQQWARTVGPAESKRTESIEALKKYEDLEQNLLAEIGGPDQALALDVISALKMHQLAPQLLEKIPADPSGFTALTLNSLLSKENYSELSLKYRALLNTDLSPANLIALLEPLGRMGNRLPRSFVSKLIGHEYPEVRSAVLTYARLMVLKHQHIGYYTLFKKAKSDKSYQLQQQIASFLSEVEANDEIKDKLAKADFFVVEPTKPNFRIDGFDLRVIFGYKDSRPERFVGDRHERVALVQRLMRPCSEDELACGFRRHSKDSDLFLKKIPREGSAEPMRIHLYVTHSSASTEDQSNRQDPYQKVMTSMVKEQFHKGLAAADMVYYNGHSRFGGGPDFEPPKLNAEGKVDVDYYKNNDTGKVEMIEALKVRKQQETFLPLKELGMFSCSSSQHFRSALLKTGVRNVMTSRRLMHYAEALTALEEKLNKFLGKL